MVYFAIEGEQMWVSAGQELKTRKRKIIRTSKTLLTAVWNPDGFHVVYVLSKRRKSNSDHCLSNILTLICNGAATSSPDASAKLLICVENVSFHPVKWVKVFW
jgi:hypothetical protein